MNFVFYDLETTGLSPAYDQPLQFAAVLTDGSFTEIEEVNIRCRLAPHILPSPHALVVTGVSPDQLTDPSLPSPPEFARQIAELAERWSPAVWTGYNSMSFDENMLRQAFYQNLLPEVYATQFNGNTRFDIMKAVYAAHARAPGLFTVPAGDKGRPTFKLDRLAPENGFNAHDAHDALGDVKATIHIARKLATENPELWAELLDNAYKARVQAKLESFRPYELVERFGGGEPQSYIGCFCGYSRDNKTQAGFFDLDAADPADLISASDGELFKAVDETPKTIRGLATNQAPALLEIPEPSDKHRERAAVIEGSPEFQRRVGAAMAERFVEDPEAPAEPVEKQIYGGFYSPGDKQLLEEFHRADWPRRQKIVERLEDSRLRQLGRRLVAFYSPELLSSDEAARLRGYLEEKWSSPDVEEIEWMTLGRAQKAIGALRAEGEVDGGALDAIAAFIESRCDLPGEQSDEQSRKKSSQESGEQSSQE